jgi:hypothetical protein
VEAHDARTNSLSPPCIHAGETSHHKRQSLAPTPRNKIPHRRHTAPTASPLKNKTNPIRPHPRKSQLVGKCHKPRNRAPRRKMNPLPSPIPRCAKFPNEPTARVTPARQTTPNGANARHRYQTAKQTQAPLRDLRVSSSPPSPAQNEPTCHSGTRPTALPTHSHLPPAPPNPKIHLRWASPTFFLRHNRRMPLPLTVIPDSTPAAERPVSPPGSR